MFDFVISVVYGCLLRLLVVDCEVVACGVAGLFAVVW